MNRGADFLNTTRVSPLSFKGAYILKGSPEVLDEICWFLQKKKTTSNNDFDFIDIRLTKKSLNPTEKLLNQLYTSNFGKKEQEEIIVNHILDLFSIKEGRKKDFLPLLHSENFDLFVTKNDKTLAESKMINMVEESLENILKTVSLKDKFKILLENLSQMRKNLSAGRPIVNIHQGIFDIVNGVM